MSIAFVIFACLTIVSALAAMTWRRLVHCALSLVVTFVSLAGLYLQLNAQFVGFAQVLVYVGAVAMLILFAVLLTRAHESAPKTLGSKSWFTGVAIAIVVSGSLITSILTTPLGQAAATRPPTLSVRDLGERLMTDYVLPLEVIALLLTAAMIGGVIIAMPESTAPTSSKGESESTSTRPIGRHEEDLIQG